MKSIRLHATLGLLAAALLPLMAGCPATPGLQPEATAQLTGAQILFNRSDYRGAAAGCSQYIQQYPDSPVVAEAYYLRGLCMMYTKQGAAAGSDLAHAAERAGDDADLRFKSRLALAHVAYEQSRYVEAAALYGSICDQADPVLRPELLFRQGMALNVTGRKDDGVKIFRRLLAEYPSSSAAERLRKRVAEPAPDSGGGRYAVQIGAFSDPANAQQALAQLSGKGYPASVEPRQKGGRTLHAVVVGWYATAGEAEQVRRKLLATYREAIVVTR